jgi:predicted phosphodiesterase
MKKSELVKQYVEKFPDHGNRTIALLVIKENPNLFTSIDSARSCVRYVRGNNGKQDRAKRKNKSEVFKPNGKAGEYKIPKSLTPKKRIVRIPDGKTLILSDIHLPYHDVEALECALDHGHDADNVILNGDTVDFYATSRWDTDPNHRDLAGELQASRQFLLHLRERFPTANIYFKIGNHEERWEKYLWRKAPELCGVPDFKMEKLLNFEDLDIQEIGGRQLTKAGGLWILHGHEFFNTFDPVNFARTLQVKTGVCTIAGHKHKSSQHSVKSMDGDTIACWSMGCLCDLEPDYMPVNQWNLGFAEVTHKGKKFDVNNYRIIDGVAYR